MARRLNRYEEHQKYFLADGSEVAGASSIAKLGDNPEPLIRWANKQGLAGIDTTRMRDRSAAVGQISHFLIDCFHDQVEADLCEFSQEDIDMGMLGFNKFKDFWRKEGLTHVAKELMLTSELYRYGGTLDGVARDGQGRLVLLDYKSSKAVYFSHKMQLGGYEGLWNENKAEPIARRAIIRIPPTNEGEFQAHWIPNDKIRKYLTIFRTQATLFNTIKENK